MKEEQFQSAVIKSLQGIESRLNSIETRIDSIEKTNRESFTAINNYLGRIQEPVDESLRLYSQFTSDFRKRLEKLENRFS
jgi:archaellum component FlaC